MEKTSTSINFDTKENISYWKRATLEMKSTKMLVLSAIFIVLKIAIASIYFTVPLGISTSRIYFSYVITSIGCMIYGPVVGFWSGFVSDTVGYLIHPTGVYFFGYCITSMATGLVYGIFFYRKKITILRLACGKLAVNIICNILLNGLWSSMLSGGHLLEVLIARTPKNIIMLPVEILLLYIVFSVVVPVLRSKKIISFIPYEGKMKLY